MSVSPSSLAAGATVPQRFVSRAAAVPKHVAVADAARRLTYEQLERESNDLAARLQDFGAGPERCVGIFTERSTGFVVAALAVLKSGGAYVPLDPSTPPDRASWILTDAGVVAVVTDAETERSLPDGSWPRVRVDRPGANGPRRTPAPHLDPDALAYVVYTSGSTGRPKGVEVTHANLCNLVDWHHSAFGLSAADRASQVAGLGFDAAGWEIWPYLAAGASLFVADESTRRSAETLRRWLVEQQITIGFVPTAMAEELFRASWPDETKLRLLLTGGDTLQLRPRADLPFAVINNYGPTECTVVATSGAVSSSATDSTKPSIGHPIANATALILDDSLHTVARGKIGELCIGGALVARGYRNLPELTSTQFVSVADERGAPLRVYRTGDRVRLLENGELEFLGRMDEQVKIRGYRIELGEIEACLRRYPGIAAATLSVADGAGGPALVAYVVLAQGERITESELRKHLASTLPDYMMPASFVALGALPLTSNGKIDKTALPPPGKENSLPKAPAANGKSANVERQITGLVASLMSRPSIGADENFFMIGGHSMFGVQLVARIRETFGVRLPLRDLFTAPTVRELSNEVARLMSVD